MNGLFSYEGVLAQTLCKIGKCMCLGVLWLISALPILTIGAANTALAYSVKKVRADESGIFKLYWKSFRQNFSQATVAWIVVALLEAGSLVSCYCAYTMFLNGIVGAALPLVLVLLVAVIMMWACYVFPSIAFFTNSTKTILKNCVLLAIHNFLWSILLVLLSFFLVIGSVLIPMGFLVIPAVVLLVKSNILDRIFKKYLPQEETAEEDQLE